MVYYEVEYTLSPVEVGTTHFDRSFKIPATFKGIFVLF
jgi:hypothetical protein